MTSTSDSGSGPEGCCYRLVIPHYTEARVLLLACNGGLVLPSFESRVPGHWEEVAAINAAVEDLLGLRAVTLRAIALDWDLPGEGRVGYYALDNIDPGWGPPPGGRWLDRSDLDAAEFHVKRDRAILEGWFADVPASNRVLWYRPGWFDDSAAWMLDELAKREITATGAVEQLRSWERSSILRVETDAGRIYFKAVPPQWGHEPELTAYLARRFSDRTPDVLLVDPKGRRMFLTEFPGRPVSEVPDIGLWRRAYRAFAEMQIDLAGRLDDLRGLGLTTRPIEEIEAGINELLAGSDALLVGHPGGLTEGEVRRLTGAIPRLKAACRELTEGDIPLSLDHGDFWPGNIAASEERLVLFDWSDATISHPFFSLVMVVDEVNAALPGIPNSGEQVRDAYLQPWTRYEPLSRLREAFDLAMLVAPLHQALMYRDTYLPAMEHRWELERMLPMYLRWLAGKV